MFSDKFMSLNMQILKNFKNTIFTAYKLSKYYLNSIVISCSRCQKEKKECIGLNMWFTQSCRNFNFVIIYTIFLPKILLHRFSELTNKKILEELSV